MARPLRVQFPNAVYHVTCRGNERKDIFLDNHDRKRFLELLQKSLEIYQVILYAYVLMRNHFHLLVETPLGNLSEFMRHFNITYTLLGLTDTTTVQGTCTRVGSRVFCGAWELPYYAFSLYPS